MALIVHVITVVTTRTVDALILSINVLYNRIMIMFSIDPTIFVSEWNLARLGWLNSPGRSQTRVMAVGLTGISVDEASLPTWSVFHLRKSRRTIPSSKAASNS